MSGAWRTSGTTGLAEEVRTNVELPTVQSVHHTCDVEGAISNQTTSQAARRAAISSQVRDVSNQIQVATHAGVQVKAGPTAVHVVTANEETQLRAVHVGAAAVQLGAANETQLQTVDQNMAYVQTDHDMADVAVVEPSNPHEDEEHVEW